MSAPYLISKAIDPIFATSIGVAAAVVRINREEKEKGRSTEQSIETLKRRVNMVMEKSGEEGKVAAGSEKGAK
ncbi:hypothetical protein KC332_g15546 [Hortaea werneckii]|uniref:Uncharacterized protein n=2 Tax=Hortaea werneckii TaxID=91943 RepID=A0A3M7I8L3_HORWE|nr:hypothetical protein KC358_g15492 [Hortaea werneckii]OTA33544.1 hypothetical protein BTJ68_05226 [Hortaea werneckii EXF-2000]KAI6806377.1 hypothetical protein KC350_g14203 [Hortaea werneckii]KAI6813982.1 hypothetical protein KC342_g16589 [Hortaea werneckii]KAI6905917.1 hypothetical protein KC348_g14834 [Hortaea werneckii]